MLLKGVLKKLDWMVLIGLIWLWTETSARL